MKDSWIQATLSQDQFQKLDRWIYTFILNSGKPDPLDNLDYCVLVKKPTSLNREVIFSPNCLPLLSAAQPEFFSLNTKMIATPVVEEVRDSKQPFIFWFGNVHYFYNTYPADAL
ncbi:hypothetical protein [Chryseolinea lacunae]|uniref:Uncharacterized protein n=1 Tax=Chryseolinea lacunae TaxID=2801331 RepID=A0ABS1L2L7_9BACT|nr:hypothetical protein [Chryseolinea lacunae]MBL0745930.1 hypothetical protein [Chryseolinea lacunae]